MSDSERSDVDARFAEIIAHWDEIDSSTDHPSPGDRTGPEPDATMAAGIPGIPGMPDVSPLPDMLDLPAPPGLQEADDPSAAAATAGAEDWAAPPPSRAPGERSDSSAPPEASVPPAPSAPSAPSAHSVSWRAQPTPESEDHFEPPPPAPLPAGDLQFWGIVLGLCGGPLLLLYLMVFDRDAGSLWTATAILLTLGGFGLLVARQPHRRPDDGDDGARL